MSMYATLQYSIKYNSSQTQKKNTAQDRCSGVTADQLMVRLSRKTHSNQSIEHKSFGFIVEQAATTVGKTSSVRQHPAGDIAGSNTQ